MTGHLLLIDASGFAHQAFHGRAATYRRDGLPTWAITGFLSLMWRLLGAAQADQPTHAAAVFDAPGKTFRHKLFPAYKANRGARSADLARQLPYLRRAAQLMGVTPIEREGFEADDLIATMARMGREAGHRVTIISRDKDFCQCVVDGAVEIIDPMTRQRTRESDVARRFGVTPAQVTDVQALAGDAVDNIPGVDRIGLEKAAVYVNKFGDLDGVISAAAERVSFIAADRERILAACAALPVYKSLATLITDVPVPEPFDTFAVRPILRGGIDELLAELEATASFEAIFKAEPQLQRLVERIPDDQAHAWWQEELLARLPFSQQPPHIRVRKAQSLPLEPQAGYYLRKLHRNGVPVPCRIFRESWVDYFTKADTGHDLLQCLIGTEPADAVLEWPKLALLPIKQEKYEYMLAVANWARTYAPAAPEADPRKAVNWNEVVLK